MTAEAVMKRPAPSYDAAIFRIHFTRTLIPALVICLTLYLAFYTLSLVIKVDFDEKTRAEFLDVTVLVTVVLLALPVGTAPFGRRFKEEHLLFFHSLPIRRWRQWLLLMLSSVAALLICYASLAVIRPSATAQISWDSSTLTVAMLIVCTFAAGSCFGMMFTRPVAVYVTAYTMVGFLFAASFATSSAPYYNYFDVEEPGSQLGAASRLDPSLATSLFVAAAGSLTVFFLVASLWFYVRGEVTLLRIQLRNLAAVIVGGFLVSITATAVMIALPAERLTWRWDIGVSDGGRYISQLYRNEPRPWQTTLKIADTRTGETRVIAENGIMDFAWLPSSRVVLRIRDGSPLRRLGYIRDPRDWLEVRDAEGRIQQKIRLAGTITAAAPLDNGHAFLVRREQGRGTVADVDLSTGRVHDLVTAPLDGATNVTGNLIAFRNVIAPSRIWRIQNGHAAELSWIPTPQYEWAVSVMDSAAYYGATLIQKLEKETPLPRTAGQSAMYAVGRGRLTDLHHAYGVTADRTSTLATLWLLDQRHQWKSIDRQAELSLIDIPANPMFGRWDSTSIPINYDLGIAAWVSRQGETAVVRLHDARTGRTIVAYQEELGPSQRLSIFMRALHYPPRTVTLNVAKSEGDQIPRRVAEFTYTDGVLSPIAGHNGLLQAVLPSGDQIRDATKMLLYRADGTSTNLFRP